MYVCTYPCNEHLFVCVCVPLFIYLFVLFFFAFFFFFLINNYVAHLLFKHCNDCHIVSYQIANS